MANQDSRILPAKLKPALLNKFIRLNRRHIAVYSIISLAPPIFYVFRFSSEFEEFTDSFRILFDYLKDRTAYFLYAHTEVSQDHAKALAVLEDQHRREYPKFRFIHLCNFDAQLQTLEKFGLETLFCNQNAMVDENLYKPLLNIEKKYDAVYDARFQRYKRHYLASKLPSLGLIHYPVLTKDEPDYVREIKEKLADAHFFNHTKTGEHRKLSLSEVNQALNRCSVGLCLSAEEGAMYASIQYLLAGLPVVTTPNVGGRDEFFDDEISITVEPTPEAVKAGVAEMIGRNLDPQYIRAKTLERMKVHRGYFIELIQNIYDQEGVKREFANEWNTIFGNKLVKNLKHFQTIEQLKSLG